jgi:hypothetical protein
LSNPALEAYEARTDLHGYGDNGLLLFALQLYFKLTAVSRSWMVGAADV